MLKNIITSESVGIGHPDKMCDQISDLILERYITEDPTAKVACETFAVNKTIIIGGEITSAIKINRKKIVKEFLKKLKYNPNSFKIIDKVNNQSPDIAQAVFKKDGDIAAGDQGIVYGYATDETDNFMPIGINIANEILKNLTDIAEFGDGTIKYDMKSQVSIEYDGNTPKRIDCVLVSCQHAKGKINEANKIIKKEIDLVLKNYDALIDDSLKILINPSGKFEIGGPIGDTGLTGRKIIVDTYGGIGKHGGGAFSGKDPSKVDRTGAYYARFIAKNIILLGLAKKAEVQLSFAIGKNKPLSIHIETFGTSTLTNEQILKTLNEKNITGWTVKQMIDRLVLPFKHYISRLAAFGHFGRTEWKALPPNWERYYKEICTLFDE